VSIFSSLGKIAGGIIGGPWGAALTGVSSLLGGGGGGESGQQTGQMTQQQKDLIAQQADLAKQQAAMYQNVGAPAYQTALQGLMSSYGYRPASSGVAGTSLGSTTTGTTATPNYFAGGTFGYNAGLGQQLGSQTDVYTKAKQHIMDLASSGQIPQSLVAGAMAHLEAAQAANIGNIEIQNQQQGPQALLAALNPALNAGSTAATIAGNATGGAYNLGQQQQGAYEYNQNQQTASNNATMTALAQIAQALKLKTPTILGGMNAPVNPVAVGSGISTSVNPISPNATGNIFQNANWGF
jgi:hypothetical protein